MKFRKNNGAAGSFSQAVHVGISKCGSYYAWPMQPNNIADIDGDGDSDLILPDLSVYLNNAELACAITRATPEEETTMPTKCRLDSSLAGGSCAVATGSGSCTYITPTYELGVGMNEAGSWINADNIRYPSFSSAHTGLMSSSCGSTSNFILVDVNSDGVLDMVTVRPYMYFRVHDSFLIPLRILFIHDV